MPIFIFSHILSFNLFIEMQYFFKNFSPSVPGEDVRVLEAVRLYCLPPSQTRVAVDTLLVRPKASLSFVAYLSSIFV